jgi:hypothetical protein
MSDRTATTSAPAKESSTTTSMTTPAATTILSIDLGKFKAAGFVEAVSRKELRVGHGQSTSHQYIY